jgi:hypothetical protein
MLQPKLPHKKLFIFLAGWNLPHRSLFPISFVNGDGRTRPYVWNIDKEKIFV